MSTTLYVIEMRDARVWKTTSWAFHSIKEANKRAEELRMERISKEIRVQKYNNSENTK